MQMIALMDSLLKRVNLDLRLLTYSILATGQRDGIMQFVSHSTPISAILAQHGSILNFLRLHNADKSSSSGVSARAMDTFIRSCAGYCVITYILGIGDRHMDNIMLTTQGQLFHIDFGYIFGNDPKPYPPPFRLTRQMVDVMGGEEGELFEKFKSYCCQAFLWLRKSANLILNLLKLMSDAGIPDLSDDPFYSGDYSRPTRGEVSPRPIRRASRAVFLGLGERVLDRAGSSPHGVRTPVSRSQALMIERMNKRMKE